MSEKAPSDWYREFFKGSWLQTQAAMKGDPELAAREVGWLVERLELEADMRVLDVPCGTARHSVELARRGLRVLGVDLSTEVLAAAKERLSESGVEGVELLQADMRALPRDASFDGAFCWWGSFGYLEGDGDIKFAQAVAASLRKGARFAIDVIPLEAFLMHHASESLRFADGVLFGEIRNYDPRSGRNESQWHQVANGEHEVRTGSIRIYSCHELIALLEGAGFENVELHSDLEGSEWRLGDGRCRVLATRAASP